MPPDRMPPVSKRKPPTFKPPRPTTTTSSTTSHKKPTKTTAPPTRRKSAPAKPLPSLSPSRSPSPSSDESTISTNAINDPPPTLPPKLLTTLLHHHFERDDTRISKDANKLVGKYVEVFVKEAIARAGCERREAQVEGAADGEAGFLEVEDLEKLAPQLWLDF